MIFMPTTATTATTATTGTHRGALRRGDSRTSVPAWTTRVPANRSCSVRPWGSSRASSPLTRISDQRTAVTRSRRGRVAIRGGDDREPGQAVTDGGAPVTVPPERRRDTEIQRERRDGEDDDVVDERPEDEDEGEVDGQRARASPARRSRLSLGTMAVYRQPRVA
ncbi:hypothetical protein GF314_13030 [bacterium]|nr:hypothetical protein [bacterium]